MESNLILFEAEVSVLSQLVCRLNACLNSAQNVVSIPLSRLIIVSRDHHQVLHTQALTVSGQLANSYRAVTGQ